MGTNSAYRLALGAALLTAFLLVWVIGAVGLIGAEGDPADRMYIGVLAIAAVGALIARFQPLGMARALVATACGQALVAAVALLIGRHEAAVSSVAEIVIANGVFAALWLGSAGLFRSAARERRAAAAH